MRCRASWFVPAITVASVAAGGILDGGLVTGAGARAAAAPPPVSVFPSPGTRLASPRTQISFRGVARGDVGPLQVDGTRSGRHDGRLLAHSDGRGASFLPAKPFTPGETVVVRTRLAVRGARDGDFRIRIAVPGDPIRPAPPLPAPPLGGPGVQTFQSRPDLVPARITVTGPQAGLAPGDLFVGKLAAPGGNGPGQNGPMVLDPHGRLLWFHPLRAPYVALDVRVQRYEGQPVMTWWQGFVNRGVGAGVGVILDRAYRQVAAVRAGNGYRADPHEFLLTPRGTALVLVEDPVVWDLSPIHGARRAVVYDSVVQEIDVKTGLVLYEWHSLDDVSVAESYIPPPKVTGHLYDYFHVNSVGLAPDGSLLVSARNTWGIYKLDGATGAVLWRLGGKRSSFRMSPGSTFAWQHDARVDADGAITLFDDGAAPPVHTQSHGIAVALDTHAMRAWLVRDYRHAPKLLTGSQGNIQTLANRDVLVGWGALPFASELDPHGRLLADYRFPAGDESYRAYRFLWDPRPAAPPDVRRTVRDDGSTQLAMSWNGAGNVVRWAVLAGPNAASLTPLATVRRSGFETIATVRTSQPTIVVQPLDTGGHVLASVAPIASGHG